MMPSFQPPDSNLETMPAPYDPAAGISTDEESVFKDIDHANYASIEAYLTKPTAAHLETLKTMLSSIHPEKNFRLYAARDEKAFKIVEAKLAELDCQPGSALSEAVFLSLVLKNPHDPKVAQHQARLAFEASNRNPDILTFKLYEAIRVKDVQTAKYMVELCPAIVHRPLGRNQNCVLGSVLSETADPELTRYFETQHPKEDCSCNKKN